MRFGCLSLLVCLVLAFGAGSAPARADFLVADSGNNQILRYSLANNNYSVLVTGDAALNGPTGLVLDANGDLLVTSRNTNEIRRYNVNNGSFINSFAASAPLPTDLKFRGNGNLLVAKLAGNSLEQFQANGTSLGNFTQVGGGAPSLLGSASFAFGPDGNLYVGSFGDISTGAGGSILVFNASTGAYVRQLGPAFLGTSALQFDSSGFLWANSVYESRVLRLDVNANGGAGSIVSEFSPGANTFPQTMMFSPYASNELLIGLGGAGGVFRFGFDGTPLGQIGGSLGLPGQMLALAIPEPSVAGLLVVGLAGLACARRRVVTT